MKQRSALKHEARVLGPVDFGAGQIGWEQIGCELHAMEVALDAGRKLLYRGGLGQTRCTLHEEMAVRQQGDKEAVDQRVLADDSCTQGVAKLTERALRRRHRLLRAYRVVHLRCRGCRIEGLLRGRILAHG